MKIYNLCQLWIVYNLQYFTYTFIFGTYFKSVFQSKKSRTGNYCMYYIALKYAIVLNNLIFFKTAILLVLNYTAKNKRLTV